MLPGFPPNEFLWLDMAQPSLSTPIIESERDEQEYSVVGDGSSNLRWYFPNHEVKSDSNGPV